VEKFLMDEKADFTLFRELLERSWDKGMQDLAAPGDPLLKKELQDALHEELFAASSSGTTPVSAKNPTPVIGLRQRPLPWLRYGIAAAMLGILVLGAYKWQQNNSRKTAVAAAPAVVWKTLTNTSSEQKRAVLPDNTHIWLNPGSQLSYASGFINGQRLIRLKGEAFFDVAQDVAHPFIVQAGGISTKVLGTSFNIEAYPNERNAVVSLVNGKVAVQDNVLEAGQLLTYNTSSGEHHTTPLKMTNMADWTSGQVIFNNVALKDALERTAARYHLTLVYARGVDLKNRRFTSVFSKESPDEMLRLMLFVSDCHFHRKGNTVEIF
jgi:ferric-dicitrate binding protein FerR (iron transport regulator)